MSKPEPHLGGVFGGNDSGSTMLLFSRFPINKIKEIKKQESVRMYMQLKEDRTSVLGTCSHMELKTFNNWEKRES